MTDKEFAWIEANIAERPEKLRLAVHGRNDGIDYESAITQIECRRKFATKLQQTLASFPRFLFPSVLAGEQATSDLLADYHTSLTGNYNKVLDLTAGLGIDIFHIAVDATQAIAVELDHARAEALKYNAAGLRLDNVDIIEGDCIDYIDRCIADNTYFDAAFIDPARRASDGSRVFALADCEPDIVALLPKVQKICKRLIIKASPMLDITHTVNALSVKPSVIAAVGTPIECKELLIIIDFDREVEETIIEAVTLSRDGNSTFSFTHREEESAPMPALNAPLKAGDYIYESSPALMKAGAFKLVASTFGLSVFHPNTRLYYSTDAIDGFPGRRYRVVESMPYASKVIKRFKSKYPRIEVAVRNFGISADNLRAKLGVRDGGSLRLYGYTDSRTEQMLAVVEHA